MVFFYTNYMLFYLCCLYLSVLRIHYITHQNMLLTSNLLHYIGGECKKIFKH